MFGIAPQEVLIVGICALVLFGNRLPDVGRTIEQSLDEDPLGLLLMLILGVTSLVKTFARS